MSGHNKWSQIKRQKGKTDAQKSKVFTKYAKLISSEAKKAGSSSSPSLLAIIENAKKENVPKDVIERAIKKATETGTADMESITYEAYGPGGCAIVIEALTENRNKAVQEIKHILSKNGGFTVAAPGSATWAFTKTNGEWTPNMTVPLSDEDLAILEKLVDDLEDNDEVQTVFTNVE